MQSRYTALKLPIPETKTAAPEFGIVMIPKSLTPYEKIHKVVRKRLWLKNEGVRYSIVSHYHTYNDEIDGKPFCDLSTVTNACDLQVFIKKQKELLNKDIQTEEE